MQHFVHQQAQPLHVLNESFLPTKGSISREEVKHLLLQVPVVHYKKFIRACKNCINLLINVIRMGNFLNFISNFFLFRATFEQLLCFLASNFLVLASNFLGFYEHNRAMPKSGNPGIRESGNRGIRESGNRGIQNG